MQYNVNVTSYLNTLMLFACYTKSLSSSYPSLSLGRQYFSNINSPFLVNTL